MVDKPPTETGIREGNSKSELETKTMVKRSAPVEALSCKSCIVIFFEMLWLLLILIPSVFVAGIRSMCKGQKDLTGKIVLVTGAGNGLGKEIALQLCALGCTVLCVDQKSDDNKKTMDLIREKKGTGKAYTCDVADFSQVRHLSDRILDEYGRVDVIINNAGIIFGNSVLTGTQDQIVKVFSSNFLSALWIIRAFLPSMISNKEGHIVCIGSASGIHALGHGNIYSCTKFAILGLVYSMLEEFRSKEIDKEIKISCALPYFVSTSKAYTRQWKLRYPPLSTEKAAALIIEGFRKEFRFYTVPWVAFGYTITSILRLLPFNVYNYFRDKSYADFISESPADKYSTLRPRRY